MEASRIPSPAANDNPDALRGSALTRLVRRWAQELPEEPRREYALLAAERLEEVERRIGPVLARPLREHGLEPLARQVERNPVATVTGALLAAWVARRLLR